MPIEVKHTTQAVGTDAGNGEIRKAQWNEAHTINMATSKLLGRSTAGTGPAEEIAIGSGLALSAGTLSASGGATNGIVWSAPITYNVTSTDPASVNYWYPGFVTGGGPVYVYISMVPTSGASNANYHKILLVSPASNVNPDVLVNNFSDGYKIYEAALLFGNTQNLGKTALRLRFLSRPPVSMTVSVSFGFPADNGATLTSVNSWSSSTTLPTEYTNASIFTTTYSRITSSAGSQINATYAATAGSASTASSADTANSASSAGTATFSSYAMGLRHEYGNWNALISGSSPTNGQVLAYNSSSGRFEPATAGGGGGVTSIIAGTGISISSTGPNGTGAVTVSASGGGGGGGANPPPAGAAGVTLSSGLDGSSGYMSYPPEFTPTGTWNNATLRAYVVTTSSAQPFPEPSAFLYDGIVGTFSTSYGTMYIHRYSTYSFAFGSLDPNGFYYSGLSSVSASALVFTSTYPQTPDGFAGYAIFNTSQTSYGPGIEFPTLPPPPNGTYTTYDSKELVFFQSGDTFTPATGVTELATVAGPFRVSLFSVPQAFVAASGPPPSPNLTYNGSWSVGVVGIAGHKYTP